VEVKPFLGLISELGNQLAGEVLGGDLVDPRVVAKLSEERFRRARATIWFQLGHEIFEALQCRTGEVRAGGEASFQSSDLLLEGCIVVNQRGVLWGDVDWPPRVVPMGCRTWVHSKRS
jgi:hypothetical protein